jgi:hypothetical protein
MPILDRFVNIESEKLSLPDVVSRLNELGESLADGNEHFGIVYIMGYRTMSSIGAHPNLEVIQSYFDSTRVTNFVRLERRARTPSAADLVNQLTLQQAAHPSFRVLGDIPGAVIPVTEEILARYLVSRVRSSISDHGDRDCRSSIAS